MKITRSTFTRKALTFGIVVFMSVALVASGFAAWLISSGSDSQQQGAIKVEVVDHANIKINVNDLAEDGHLNANTQINFAPADTDVNGYITHTTTSEGVTLTENLTFDVTGDITNGDKVGKLTFSLKISDGVAYAAGFVKGEGNTWTYDATKAYISVPSYATDMNGNALPKIVKGEDGVYTQDGMTEPVVLSIGSEETVDVKDASQNFTYKYNSTSGKYEFKATYLFGWGEAVNGRNPGQSLDALEYGEGKACAGETLPACVKKDGVYSLKKAELVIRLINAIVNNKQVNGVDAYTIDPATLDDATIDSYITALQTLQTEGSMTGATYTVVISALPKA